MAHAGEQGADRDPAAGAALALPEARVDRVDDLVEGQAALQMLLGAYRTSA